MKPLSPVEKTFLALSLCVVAGMALVQCTPAHGEELTIENDKSIEIINKQTAPQFNVLGYSVIALAKSNDRIGVLLPLDVNNRVFNRGFCLRACPIVMMGRVEVSKDTLFTNGQYANSAPPSPLDWRLLVMGFNQSLGVTNHAA